MIISIVGVICLLSSVSSSVVVLKKRWLAQVKDLLGIETLAKQANCTTTKDKDTLLDIIDGKKTCPVVAGTPRTPGTSGVTPPGVTPGVTPPNVTPGVTPPRVTPWVTPPGVTPGVTPSGPGTVECEPIWSDWSQCVNGRRNRTQTCTNIVETQKCFYFDFRNKLPVFPPGITGQYRIVQGSLWNTTGIPDFREVMQGGIGNCVFDATIAVIAYKQPQLIKSIFVSDEQVRLYKGADTITILYSKTLPVDSNGNGLFDVFFKQNGVPILWPHYLLKVFACLINSFPDVFNYGTASGYEAINFGVDGIGLMNLLTGKVAFGCPNEDMPMYYERFNDTNWIFQAGSWSVTRTPLAPGVSVDGFFFVLSNPTVYIVGSHAHSVMSYDAVKQTIVVRNPWGTYSGHSIRYTDGLVTLTVPQFQAVFGGMACCQL